MTTDLWMLIWTVMLAMVLPVAYVGGRMALPGGFRWGLGNRDSSFDSPLWVGRAQRAHANLVENLVPFAILVLVVHTTVDSNSPTSLLALLFFYSRFAPALFYLLSLVPLPPLLFCFLLPFQFGGLFSITGLRCFAGYFGFLLLAFAFG